MKICLRHPIREHFLSKVALALEVFVWLGWLPVSLRLYSIPSLLKRFSRGTRHESKPVLDLHGAVEIITRVCHLRPFRSRIFPKECLRQSLALYRTLTRMGHPVEIHFGVVKDEKNFHGHSWVTMAGKPVADTARSEIFKIVYSHSSVRSSSVASNGEESKRSNKVALLNAM